MKFPCDMCNSTGEVDTGGQLPSGSFVTDECPYCEGRGFYPLTILQTNYKQRIADAAREKLEAERKEQERIEAERKAEEARREAMKPDLQKLRDYAAALEAVPVSQVSDADAREVLLDHVTEVKRVSGQLEKWCDEQEAGA